jgi:diguanylate cyclase (GGDEF)-like protein
MDPAGQPHSNPPPFLAFVSRFVAFFMLLLAAKNAYFGTNLVLAAALSCLVIALSLDIRARRRGNPLPVPIPIILVMLWLIVCYSVYYSGSTRLMWAYPCVVAVFFITPRRTAIAFSTLTGLSLTGLCLFQGDTAMALRFAPAFGFSVLFLDLATSQINALQKQLEEASHRDPLTNCFNRRYLETEARKIAGSRTGRKQSGPSLALIDIDHFKQINDTQGHVAGDRVLVRIADIIRQSAEANDLLFRVGGEEFVLLMPNADLSTAERMAERIRDAVSFARFPVEGRVTVSIGVTPYDPDLPLVAILEQADRLLYAAKRSGRNRVHAEGHQEEDSRTAENA